jgi:hypothetical protein
VHHVPSVFRLRRRDDDERIDAVDAGEWRRQMEGGADESHQIYDSKLRAFRPAALGKTNNVMKRKTKRKVQPMKVHYQVERNK